jgi:serine protease Do
MNGTRPLVWVLSLALAFTIGLLFRSKGQIYPPGPDYKIEKVLAEAAAKLLESGDGPDLTLARVAARIRPSVVSLHGRGSGTEATGTGVILDRRGHILTNLHVVADLDEIVVTLSSGERYTGIMVGSDEATDVAVIRISAGTDLLPATFGDPDSVVVGQEVLAIGNAYGFGWTVTHGIISSLHRADFRNRDYTDYLQTDAAINPGNSGGPLVDTRGHVIGINTVIVSETGFSAGIGFALPATDALFVARELIRTGYVDRGYLGVEGQGLASLSRRERVSRGYDSIRGVLVTEVSHASPAHVAGFHQGDVILAMEEESVASIEALRSRVARTSPGSEVEFLVLRHGAEWRLRVSMGRAPGRS